MGIRIRPLSLGRLEVDKSVQLSMKDIGKKIKVPCIGWYLDGAREKVVIDTGPARKDWSEKYHRKMHRSEKETVRGALAQIGISPGEISIVINTHLHWDHCYGNTEFPNATIVVQRDELRYAAAPLPRDARAYETDLGPPLSSKFYKRIEVVDGDKEILPGINLIKTPGHTPGLQGVAVETEGGVYFIAGDTFNLYESLESQPPWPPGIFVDLDAFYRSAKRIQEIADYILPGHDTAVLEQSCYPGFSGGRAISRGKCEPCASR